MFGFKYVSVNYDQKNVAHKYSQLLRTTVIENKTTLNSNTQIIIKIDFLFNFLNCVVNLYK